VQGYKEDSRVFNVSTINDKECPREVSNELKDACDLHWVIVNKEFEEALSKNEDLLFLRGLMFFAWDENHRQLVWTNHISLLHIDDLSWHYYVDSIFFFSKDNQDSLFNTMNNINW
jgi:hypothetical protein